MVRNKSRRRRSAACSRFLKQKCASHFRGWHIYFEAGLVKDLQTELKNARLEGAGDLASAGGHGSESSAETATGQIQVGVVEEVVALCAKLDLEALDGSVELLVESEVGLIEGRGATGIA